jgi:glutaredoxin
MPPRILKVTTHKVLAALNRADELGGEVRDWIQDRVVVDPRYVAARKRLARLLGSTYESAAEHDQRESVAERARAAAAPAPGAQPVRPRGLGDPSIKAQVYGRKSCPWTGRAITILEKHKVDFDFVDLDDPEHEHLSTPLTLETHQRTTPHVYLRGQFVGGYNALAEIERLGQLEFALMTADERAQAPAHLRSIVITPRPDTDEIAPGEHAEPRPLPAD